MSEYNENKLHQSVHVNYLEVRILILSCRSAIVCSLYLVKLPLSHLTHLHEITQDKDLIQYYFVVIFTQNIFCFLSKLYTIKVGNIQIIDGSKSQITLVSAKRYSYEFFEKLRTCFYILNTSMLLSFSFNFYIFYI